MLLSRPPPILTYDWHHFCPNCTVLIGVPSEALIKHLQAVCRTHAHRDVMWQLRKKRTDRQCHNSLAFSFSVIEQEGPGMRVESQSYRLLNMAPLWRWFVGKVSPLGPLGPLGPRAKGRHVNQGSYKQTVSFTRAFVLHPSVRAFCFVI
jgi:hypothetical protein